MRPLLSLRSSFRALGLGPQLYPKQNGAALLNEQGPRTKVTLEAKLGIPEKPKKPLSAYFRFLEKFRNERKLQQPNASPIDTAREAGALWRQASDAEKQHFKTAYNSDCEKYARQMQKYTANISDEQQQMLDIAREKENQRKMTKMLHKRMQEANRPKRPASAFIFFTVDKKNEKGKMTHKDWLSHLGKVWNDLPQEEKAIYLAKQTDAQKNYNLAMNKWEKEMIQTGRTELVRTAKQVLPVGTPKNSVTRSK